MFALGIASLVLPWETKMMMNVLKRGVLVGRVLVPARHRADVRPHLAAIVQLCSGCTQVDVDGSWWSAANGCFVYDRSVLYEFCMFDTTRLHEVEPLLLALSDALREGGESSVMLWLRRDGQLVPHLYEES